MKPIKLKINDIIVLNKRLYRVEWSKFSNGKTQGNRAILKLLNTKELHKIVLERLK